jgi:hypothetical protein
MFEIYSNQLCIENELIICKLEVRICRRQEVLFGIIWGRMKFLIIFWSAHNKTVVLYREPGSKLKAIKVIRCVKLRNIHVDIRSCHTFLVDETTLSWLALLQSPFCSRWMIACNPSNSVLLILLNLYLWIELATRNHTVH